MNGIEKEWTSSCPSPKLRAPPPHHYPLFRFLSGSLNNLELQSMKIGGAWNGKRVEVNFNFSSCESMRRLARRLY